MNGRVPHRDILEEWAQTDSRSLLTKLGVTTTESAQRATNASYEGGPQCLTALQDKLGSRYEVTTHGSGAQQGLKVKQSAASTATVHLDQNGDATTFHVHGGGLVISRMVNEFGIAKKVAATIEEAFAARPAG